MAGRSYPRLCDEFHRTLGRTLHEFVRATRLDLAWQWLSDRSLTVQEVARRLNFSSEYYFSHWCHHAAELSPSGFRERCRA